MNATSTLSNQGTVIAGSLRRYLRSNLVVAEVGAGCVACVSETPVRLLL